MPRDSYMRDAGESDKIAKVQALIDGATTPGERQAALAALQRLRDASLARGNWAPQVVESFDDRVLAAIAKREPLDGTTVRIARRYGNEDVVALLRAYRWRPHDDSYLPSPILLQTT